MCLFAARLWKHFVNIMEPYVRSFVTWIMIATASKLIVRGWTRCHAIIGDVWHTLRAVTLHFIWSDRK